MPLKVRGVWRRTVEVMHLEHGHHRHGDLAVRAERGLPCHRRPHRGGESGASATGGTTAAATAIATAKPPPPPPPPPPSHAIMAVLTDRFWAECCSGIRARRERRRHW